jgi:hypothetical protein
LIITKELSPEFKEAVKDYKDTLIRVENFKLLLDALKNT